MLTIIGLASLAAAIWFLLGFMIEVSSTGANKLMLGIAITGMVVFGVIAFNCLVR